jgi:hypothetical protein
MMKQVPAFLLLLAAVVTLTAAKDLPFSAEDCGPRDRSIIFDSFDLTPKPLVMHLKTDLKVKVRMNVNRLVGDKIRASVKVHKVMGRWNIPLVTISKSFCEFLDDVTFKQILCPLFSKDGSAECKCPITAGAYNTDTAVITMDLGKLPVPKLLFKLGSGNWQMEIRVEDEGRKQIGCLRIRSHVKIQV